MKTIYVLLLVLTSCTGLTPMQQRVVSGAAAGGTIACFPGAAVGAAGGALWGWASDK